MQAFSVTLFMVFVTAALSQDLRIYYFNSLDCENSTFIISQSAYANECVTGFSNLFWFSVDCHPVDQTQVVVKWYQQTYVGEHSCSQGVQASTPLGICFQYSGYGSAYVTGCARNYTCTTFYSSWGMWSSTCGPATRMRSYISVYNDDAETPCNDPNAIDIESRAEICVTPEQTSHVDVCDIDAKTCWLYPDNPSPFNTIAYFLLNSAIFDSGWTLRIDSHRRDCPFNQSGCNPVEYAQLPIQCGLSNISVVSNNELSFPIIRIFGENDNINNLNSHPLCTAFSLHGNDIVMRGLIIIIDESCYSHMFPSYSLIRHAAGVRILGKNINITNMTLENTVSGILITSNMDNTLTLTTNGLIQVTGLVINRTHAVNNQGGVIASCVGAVIVSESSKIVMNFSTKTDQYKTCVVAYLPTPIRLQVKTNGVLLDTSMFVVPTYTEPKTPVDLSNGESTSHIYYEYIFIGILIALIVLLSKIISRYST